MSDFSSSYYGNAFNYMVPAGGNTHCVAFGGTLSSTPFPIDWRQFKVDNFPFQPQGVFIDNSQGTDDLVITINPLGYQIVCAKGIRMQAQFPSINGQTATVKGAGTGIVYFVDFPVLPDAGQVNIGNTVDVEITGADNAASPVYTLPPVLPQGVPYRTQNYAGPASVVSGSIAAAATSVVLSVPTGGLLRKCVIDLPADCTLATAGEVTLALTGTATFWTSAMYLPATAGTQANQLIVDFGDLAYFPTGNITLTLGAALATGTVYVNAIFGMQ